MIKDDNDVEEIEDLEDLEIGDIIEDATHEQGAHYVDVEILEKLSLRTPDDLPTFFVKVAKSFNPDYPVGDRLYWDGDELYTTIDEMQSAW